MSFLKKLTKSLFGFSPWFKKNQAIRKKRKALRLKKKKATPKKLIKSKVKTKKKTAKKPVKKTSPAKKKVRKSVQAVKRSRKAVQEGSSEGLHKKDLPETEGIYVGRVTHYFPKVKAAAILVEKEKISLGDHLIIVSHGKKIKQTVKSLQINRIPVDEGRPGEDVGIQVLKEVHTGAQVYRKK